MTKPRANFADVDYDEAMRRASGLVPLLRREAPAADAARRLTPAAMDALHGAGLFRYLQPKVRGGMELPFVSYFDIPEMLARGDISAGWVVANLASHHRNIVWWNAQAQEEIWGPDPDVGIASGIAFPQGRATAKDGGLLLDGEWNFSSGIDHSEWNILACIVRDGDRIADYAYCLVPASQYEVIDDWHTSGMRATGSKTVRCKGVFVPPHRVLSMHVAKPGHVLPGLEIHRNPQYRIPTSALGGFCISACLAGNARAALELATELVRSRSTSYTSSKMRDFQTVQLKIAAAAVRIDAAALLMRNDCAEAQRLYENGGTLDIETRLRYKRDCAWGARTCMEAVELLADLAGANGIYDHHPLQRVIRDSRAAGAHISFSLDAQLPPWGLVALGGEFKSPTL